MNKDLLFQLYGIHSMSGCEKKMRRFLRKQARDCGATGIETDSFGNLLITKGEAETYPCLAAHMDQVQHNHSKDFRVVEIGGDVIGWSPKSHAQQGLGADDKNGIFICLELLRKFDVMKVAFFVGEEVGCEGSGSVDLAFFKDCRFIIEPDRRGSSDLITSMYCGDVCSKKFLNDIGYEDYGYRIDRGTVTDVGELVERGVGISCLNLSCGYYNAHTDEEMVVLPHLENCLNFVSHIVETCKEVYPFEASCGGWYGTYNRHGYYNWGKSSVSSGSYVQGKGQGQSSIPTERELPCQDDWYYDDYEGYGSYRNGYDSYYNDGSYDNDFQLMEDYLSTQPDLTFDMILANYKDDFYASLYLDGYQCEKELREIYESVQQIRWSDVSRSEVC